jgi:pimeloyl-ACP methyl ester carboxylesterase
MVNTPGTWPLTLRLKLPVAWTPRFAPRRAHVYFDWRGTGDSDPFRGELTVDDLVADLDAVVNAVGGPVDAVCFGAACIPGCFHAARSLSSYRSIMLDQGAVDVSKTWQGNFNKIVPEQGLKYVEHLSTLARHYLDIGPVEAHALAIEHERGLPAETFAAYWRVLRGSDISSVLPLLKLPVLVSAFNPLDVDAAVEMASLIPGAQLWIRKPRLATVEAAVYEGAEWERLLGSQLGGGATSD